MQTITEIQTLPVREKTQVLVVGGGIAGVSAALAARREGAQVLLLEKSALLGGLATNGLINWFEPLCDGEGQQLITGLAEELLRLAIRYGDDTLPRMWAEGGAVADASLAQRGKKHHPIGGRYATYFSPTLFQLALDELLAAEGVTLRLDILAAMPQMEADRCLGVCCESKTGREFFPADVVVDATGDADLLHRAGMPCVTGQNYLSFVAHMCDISEKKKALAQRKWAVLGADLHGKGHPAGYPLYAGVRNEEITQFLLDGRRMLLDSLREEPRTGRDVTALPATAQFRTTRHLCGMRTLTEADCRVPQADSVGLACDFERPGDWYEIPWGCLHHGSCANLLAAGRVVSAEDWAWEVVRVIPVCALTGQAAGTAAAQMALQEDHSAARLPVDALQQRLRAQGVRLHRAEAPL